MRREWFTCGCCGDGFQSTIEVQKKYDQDEGYGICSGCDEWIDSKNEQDWTKAETTFANGLNEANRQKFLGFDTEVRRGLVLQAIEDGIMTFEIRRG